MSKLTLTKDEHEHIFKAFTRLSQSLNKLDAKELEKGNRPIIRELAIKFAVAKDSKLDEVDVILKRTHLRLLESYCIDITKRITESILPEYERRGNKEEYIEASGKLKIMLTNVLEKIQKCL
jgi:glycerol-3-phosphate dehydrogenase